MTASLLNRLDIKARQNPPMVTNMMANVYQAMEPMALEGAAEVAEGEEVGSGGRGEHCVRVALKTLSIGHLDFSLTLRNGRGIMNDSAACSSFGPEPAFRQLHKVQWSIGLFMMRWNGLWYKASVIDTSSTSCSCIQ